jgi:hypothetical protein
MNKERIYAVVHATRKQAYIGRTYETLQDRWQKHLLAAARGEDKLLFEELRHAPNEWDILECEFSETASEDEWCQRFLDDGYTLLNETGGNRKPPKRRDTEKEAELKKVLAGNAQLPSELEKSTFREIMKRYRAEWDAATTSEKA